MKIFNLEKDWHVLFIGGNGHITNGITLTHIDKPTYGYRSSFELNDYSFVEKAEAIKDHLGWSELEYDLSLLKLIMLEEKQRCEREEQERLAAIEKRKRAWAAIESKKRTIRHLLDSAKELRHSLSEDIINYKLEYGEESKTQKEGSDKS